MRRRRQPRVGVEQLESRRVLAAMPELLSNINGFADFDSQDGPTQLTAIGTTVYFTMDDGVTGRELWKSDGTAAGTVLVKDIQPGPLSSYPSELTVVGTTLFFTARNDLNGYELWKTDGTAAGTFLVKDVQAGDGGSFPSRLTAVGNTLYFVANDSVNGRELWKTDGTAAGTVLVKDIRAGSSGSSVDHLTVFGPTLYFTADDGVNGQELWKTDGTAAGTALVKDIRPGGANSSPSELTAVGGSLYFVADGTTGGELWKSDGTAGGTVLVKGGFEAGFGGWLAPSDLTAVGSGLFGTTLYFAASGGNAGKELWKSDGTAAGTVLVKDINTAGPVGSPGSFPDSLTVLGNALYFFADDGVNGRELWKSDGTLAGTTLVKDVRAGSQGSILGSQSGDAVVVGGTLYFCADGDTGLGLWKSDGTAAGTTAVRNVWTDYYSPSFPGPLTAVGSSVFFAASDPDHGRELWKSDGTAAGTALVRNVNPGDGGSDAREGTAVGGTFFFGAKDGFRGSELWKTDGTAAGTVLVKDIQTGRGSSSPGSFTALGNTLYFVADDGASGVELWKSDGTASGTVIVKDIGPAGDGSSPWSSFPQDLTVLGNILFFTASDGMKGRQLWKTDGTAAGTVLVKDVEGVGLFAPLELTVAGNTLYFSADDGANGRELWKSDGTAAGTVLVKDVWPGGFSSSPYSLTAVGTTLYFSANDGVNGGELWKSDGTAAGTVLVKDIAAGFAGSNPGLMTAVGSVLYFIADDLVNGQELWKSDGTAAGTALVKDIAPGIAGSVPRSSGPRGLTASGDSLYFSADDGLTGRELYKTIGSSGETILLKDIWPGSGRGLGYFGQDSIAPKAIGNTLYFKADDGFTGMELWKTDGTAAGTVLVKDIRSGVESSSPQFLGVLGTSLLFAANDGPLGPEPWILRETTVPAPPAGLVGTAANGQAVLTWTAPADDGRSPVTDYVVQFSADDGRTWSRFLDGVRTDAFARVNGLTNGSSYLFRVAAVNAVGTGDFSAVPVAVTPRPEVPAAPSAVQAGPGAGRVTLTWTRPADNGGATITDYFVQMSTNGGRTWTRYLDGTRPDPFANVTGLTGGTSYRFRVAAVNSAGVGAYSAPSAAVIPLSAVPDRPTDVKGKPGVIAGSVTLTWNRPSANGAAITDYFIQVSADNGLTWRRFLDGVRATASANVTGLTTGKSYLFRVAAVNAVGLGSYSLRSGPVTAG